MIYPVFPKNVPEPNSDLPENIKQLYKEAADISSKSPRSAAALLRLCLEELLNHLKIPEGKLFDRIGKAGLSEHLQKAADSVRIYGNGGVHSSEIKLDDNADVLPALFGSVNYITEQNISLRKMANELYEKIPSNKRAEIEKRNKKIKDNE